MPTCTASPTEIRGQRLRLIATTAITLLAMICAGFIFSMISRSGFWLLFSFGLIGIIVFLQSFPWLAFTIFIASDIALALQFRRLFHGRFQAWTMIVCVLIVLTFGGGFLLSRTPLYARWQPPPPPHGRLSDPLLRGYGAWRFHNLFPGTITEVRENGYVIQGHDGQTFTIDVTPGTKFPQGRALSIGDEILVIGSAKKNSIRAFGIRPFDPPKPPPLR